jgi:hypothetical protein
MLSAVCFSAQNKWGTVVSDVTQVILAKIGTLPVVVPTTITAVEGDHLRMRSTQAERISVSYEGDLYFAYVTVEDNQNNRLYKFNL